MKVFLYDKNSFTEHSITDKDSLAAKVELLNRERADRLSIVESEIFPPVGKVFEVGTGLRDKTEKEKVESKEISIDSIKEKILLQINLICNRKIISGFESGALGEVYIYDSEDIDQVNLIGAVASGGSVQYKCTRKSDGVRSFYLHTNTQIKKVLGDAATRKISLLQKCYELKNTLLALTDYDSVVGFDINTGWT